MIIKRLSTTKDDEIRIHLGANSRPISFEYYTENQGTQQTTSATYYYHYDLHGNVIRVTNSSGTTVIQYTYDQLGTIVSETNSSSIYNPFTYMGEAQVIHDDEFDTSGNTPLTGLFNYNVGYYNPKTGTILSGSGAPACTNPSSTTAEEPTAQDTKPVYQTIVQTTISASAGGVPSTKTAAASIDVEPEPAVSGMPVVEFQRGIQCTLEALIPKPSEPDKRTGMGHDAWNGKDHRVVHGDGFEADWYEWPDPIPYNWLSPFQALDAAYNRFLGGKGSTGLFHGDPETGSAYDKIPEEVRKQIRKDWRENHSSSGNITNADLDKLLAETLLWAGWTTVDEDIKNTEYGKTWITKKGLYLIGYQVKNCGPRFFTGPAKPTLLYFNGVVGAPFDPYTKGEGDNQNPATIFKTHAFDDMFGKSRVTFVSNVGIVTISLFGYSTQKTDQSDTKPEWICLTVSFGNNTYESKDFKFLFVDDLSKFQSGHMTWVQDQDPQDPNFNPEIGHYEGDARLGPLKRQNAPGKMNFSGFPSYIVKYGRFVYGYYDIGHFGDDLRGRW